MAFDGVARGFGLNGKSFYTNVCKPCEVDLSFVVTPTNGLGVTSLKSNGYVNNVFLHTSTTPASNNGFLNPNPAAGYAMIQLQNNFNAFLGLRSGSIVPPTATSTKIDNSVLVIGQAYVISVLGNSTAAQWHAVGVPAGVTPAVGVSFIAITVGAGANTSTSRVQIPGVSGITSMEVIGNTNVNISTSVAAYAGQIVILQFTAATSAGVTTPIAVAPATGSIVSMSLLFDGSSVTIDGL